MIVSIYIRYNYYEFAYGRIAFQILKRLIKNFGCCLSQSVIPNKAHDEVNTDAAVNPARPNKNCDIHSTTNVMEVFVSDV